MGERLFGKAMTLATFILMMSLTLTFAQEGAAIKIQGLIMTVDLQKNIMIVNERTFTWNQNTKFYNEKGSPVTSDRLKPRMWVYIEGFSENTKTRLVAEKIYTLPKRISNKEKHLYPFFNETKPADD